MGKYGNPQSRNEAILQNILGEENELFPPESRIEELLQAILDQGSGLPSGTNEGDMLVWDGTEWVAQQVSFAGSDVINPPVYPTPDVTLTTT